VGLHNPGLHRISVFDRRLITPELGQTRYVWKIRTPSLHEVRRRPIRGFVGAFWYLFGDQTAAVVISPCEQRSFETIQSAVTGVRRKRAGILNTWVGFDYGEQPTETVRLHSSSGAPKVGLGKHCVGNSFHTNSQGGKYKRGREGT